MPPWVGVLIFVLIALIVAGQVAIAWPDRHSRPGPRAFLSRRPHTVPSLIATTLLAPAVLELPYGYFTFLRIVVCGVSIYVAYCGYKWDKPWAMWLFGLVAVLFNPVIPVHLTQEIWQPIDLATAGLFVVANCVLTELREGNSP
ncbi:MAG: hypothetical protein JW846_01530 [Dehalococcoidia bacterium]|nr:hypothetical protein [Dehalococcoidia bacterium]